MGLYVVFLGPPGVGKGTQAVVVAKERGLAHLSTGDMLRQAIRLRTPVGEKAKPYMDRGGLVPDEVVNGLVRERIGFKDARVGFLLDGYPRNVEQAVRLDSYLDELGRSLSGVVHLTAPPEILINRIVERGRTAGDKARSDDNEEVVRRRLDVYRNETAPLVAYYRDRGLLTEVMATAEVPVVSAAISRVLDRMAVHPATDHSTSIGQ